MMWDYWICLFTSTHCVARGLRPLTIAWRAWSASQPFRTCGPWPRSMARNAWSLSQESRRFLVAGLDVFRARGLLELARLVAAKVALVTLDRDPPRRRHHPAGPDFNPILMARPHRQGESQSPGGRDGAGFAHGQPSA